MAAVLSLSYKGYRIVCSAMPTEHGEYRGLAEIMRATDGPIGHTERHVKRVDGAIHADERVALDAVVGLAKEWVDAA